MTRVVVENDGVLSVQNATFEGSVSSPLVKAGIVESQDVRAPDSATKLYVSSQTGGVRGAGFVFDFETGTISFSGGSSFASAEDVSTISSGITELTGRVDALGTKVDAIISEDGKIIPGSIPASVALKTDVPTETEIRGYARSEANSAIQEWASSTSGDTYLTKDEADGLYMGISEAQAAFLTEASLLPVTERMDDLSNEITVLGSRIDALGDELEGKASLEEVYTKDYVYSKDESYSRDEVDHALSGAVADMSTSLFTTGVIGYAYTDDAGSTVSNRLSFASRPAGWEVGDSVSVYNGNLYMDAGVISEIGDDYVEFAEDLPFQVIQDDSTFGAWSVDIAFYDPSDEHVLDWYLFFRNGHWNLAIGEADPIELESTNLKAMSLAYDGHTFTRPSNVLHYQRVAFVMAKPTVGDTVVTMLNIGATGSVSDGKFERWLAGVSVAAGSGASASDDGVALGTNATAASGTVQLGNPRYSGASKNLNVFDVSVISDGKLSESLIESSGLAKAENIPEQVDLTDYAKTSEVDTKLNDFARSDDVYKKTDTYSKTEIQSMISESVSTDSQFETWKSGSRIDAGSGASASGSDSIAIGNGAKANVGDSVAIGRDSETMQPSGTSVVAGAVAIGTGATSSNDYSIAIGNGAKASGSQSIAIGRDALVNGASNAIQIGTGTNSTANTLQVWGQKVLVRSGSTVSFAEDMLGGMLDLATAQRIFVMKSSILGKNRARVTKNMTSTLPTYDASSAVVVLEPDTITCVDVDMPADNNSNGYLTVRLKLYDHDEFDETEDKNGDLFANDTLLLIRCANPNTNVGSVAGDTGSFDIHVETMIQDGTQTRTGGVDILSSDANVLKRVSYGVWTLFSFLEVAKYNMKASYTGDIGEADKGIVVVSRRELSAVNNDGVALDND